MKDTRLSTIYLLNMIVHKNIFAVIISTGDIDYYRVHRLLYIVCSPISIFIVKKG